MNTNWQELKREFYMRRENAISARSKKRRNIPEDS